jgi:hypothetical protein
VAVGVAVGDGRGVASKRLVAVAVGVDVAVPVGFTVDVGITVGGWVTVGVALGGRVAVTTKAITPVAVGVRVGVAVLGGEMDLLNNDGFSAAYATAARARTPSVPKRTRGWR